MRITLAHQNFWAYHRGPKWLVRKVKPSIHTCINDHAGLKSRYLEANNLLAILQLTRKRERLSETLNRLALTSARISGSTARRRALARYWFQMITKGQTA